MSRSVIRSFVVVGAIWSVCSSVEAAPDKPGSGNPQRFTVPPGFRIERVAADALTGSLWAMTFDPKGRIVVSRQQGAIYTLIDEDGDGLCEASRQFSYRLTHSEGLCFVDGWLYTVGQGPDWVGLYRLKDDDGDDWADTIETVSTFKSKGMGEHAPHGVTYGPDGCMYVMVGNHAWLPGPIEPDSPLNAVGEGLLLPRYADPNGHARGILAPGGMVVRIDSERKRWALVAGGFRNAYDIAFNAAGELFTYDSDMEWDEHLPWYRPTRVNHLVPGGDYGWRHGSGKRPPYHVDSLPTTIDMGRGSPCGLVFYEHDAYPEKYRGAFFMSDWSRGRILAVFLERDGATYSGRWETFVTGRPLNVNDIEVGPDGALYFSIGGRNTEGGVYRIVYDAGESPPSVSLDAAPASAETAVRQLQPDAAWARARVASIKKKLGDDWAPALLGIARDASRNERERGRALTLLQQFGPPPDQAALVALSRDGNVQVRGTAVFLLGLRSGDAVRGALAARLSDTDAMIRRRACEAFVRAGLQAPVARLIPLLADEDRWVRHAARGALGRIELAQYRNAILATDNPRIAIEGMLTLIQRDARQAVSKDHARKQLDMLGRTLPDDLLLDAIRLAQLTHIRGRGQGTVPEAMDAMRPFLLRAFDGKDWRVKREAARLLAYLQEPRIIAKMLDEMESDAPREQQIHYAYSLRVMKSGWTRPARDRFVDWFGLTREWSGGASFSGYLDMLWDSTLELLPPGERDEILAELDEPLDGGDPVSRAIAQAKAAKNRHAPEKLEQYLLREPAGRRGNARNGREVFAKAGCAACHKFGDQTPGRGVGPDLTDVAARFKRTEILESILEPNKVISDQYEAINVLTTDGAVIAGIPVENDEKRIVLKRTNGTELTLPRSDVVRTSKATSMMPEGTLNVLDLEQIADLFAYLEDTPPDAKTLDGTDSGN